MKKSISILLIFLVLFLNWKEVLWLSSFQLFQQEIAEKWCINKFDAALMCGGRCYLFEQLEDLQQEQEGPLKYQTGRALNTSFFLKPQTHLVIPNKPDCLRKKKNHFVYQELVGHLYDASPFIPPEQTAAHSLPIC